MCVLVQYFSYLVNIYHKILDFSQFIIYIMETVRVFNQYMNGINFNRVDLLPCDLITQLFKILSIETKQEGV